MEKKKVKKKNIEKKTVKEKDIEKKDTRYSIIRVIIAVILVLIISLYIDFGIVKLFNRIPIFSVYKNNTYNALFYRAWDCDGDIHIDFYDSKYTCPEKLSIYKIIDETAECDNEIEAFYEDDYFTYYFDCKKSDTVFVRLNNGEKLTMKEALSSGKITIEQILNKNYSIYREAKFILEIVNDENNEERQLIKYNNKLTYDLYVKGIKEINIIINNNTYSLVDALNKDIISMDYIIDDLDYQYRLGNITKGVITNIIEGKEFTVYYKNDYQYIYGKDKNNVDKYYIVH